LVQDDVGHTIAVVGVEPHAGGLLRMRLPSTRLSDRSGHPRRRELMLRAIVQFRAKFSD
jgi:hypothetical protein